MSFSPGVPQAQIAGRPLWSSPEGPGAHLAWPGRTVGTPNASSGRAHSARPWLALRQDPRVPKEALGVSRRAGWAWEPSSGLGAGSAGQPQPLQARRSGAEPGEGGGHGRRVP